MLMGLRDRLDESSLLSMRYENFIAEPEHSLASVCHFLGLEAAPDYLAACSGILHKSPDRSRTLVHWKPRWIEQVKDHIDQFGFLAGYSFED